MLNVFAWVAYSTKIMFLQLFSVQIVYCNTAVLLLHVGMQFIVTVSSGVLVSTVTVGNQSGKGMHTSSHYPDKLPVEYANSYTVIELIVTTFTLYQFLSESYSHVVYQNFFPQS